MKSARGSAALHRARSRDVTFANSAKNVLGADNAEAYISFLLLVGWVFSFLFAPWLRCFQVAFICFVC